VPLFQLEGLVVNVDRQNQRLVLEVTPDWYVQQRLNLQATPTGQPLPAPLGALLNYGLQASQSGDAPLSLGSTQVMSLFGSAGLVQLATAVRSVDAGLGASGQGPEKKFIRLGTTFWRDDPQQLTTWSVGDEVLQAGTGVPSVRYGGITWQSHFGLNPGFSTMETPTLFDSARLPSTLEFFLNDRRIGAPVAVAPGAFEVTGLPTVGVNGMVRVLIRDALNNERMVAVPYLQSASLYRAGLHGFSYSVGLLRPDLDRYETPFVASVHRWGVARHLTLDAGVALSARQRSAGGGVTMAVLGNVIGTANLALSRAPAGTGHKFGASAQWQGSRASMGASYSRASAVFELLGDAGLAENRTKEDVRWFAARALGHGLGSVSAGLGRLTDGLGQRRGVGSLGWSKAIGRVNMSVSAVHTSQNTQLQWMVNVPLERRAFWSASVYKAGPAMAMRTDYTSAPVTDQGLAWRVGLVAHDGAAAQDQNRALAGLNLRTDWGEHGLDLVGQAHGAAWRARTAGSLGMLGGHGFYGPPITGGFALVSTGDAPGIPVYRWNLPVAVSDARGMALVTNLSPYQKNLLAIKPEQVPLQYRIDSHEITAIPTGRGGVLVDFSMARERPALVMLTHSGGEVLPAGASVRVLASGEAAFVGLRGEDYLRDLPDQADLEVRWAAKTCRVSFHHPEANDPQPRRGPFVCQLIRTP
jgi:outer membrane usher protein